MTVSVTAWGWAAIGVVVAVLAGWAILAALILCVIRWAVSRHE